MYHLNGNSNYFAIFLCIVSALRCEAGLVQNSSLGKNELDTQEILFSQAHFVRQNQNCTQTSQVYIVDIGKCLKQIPLHSNCTYDQQCESITFHSICAIMPFSGNAKTCICKENYIPSGMVSNCVPKRSCSQSEPIDDNYFKQVEPERGSCRENEICLKQLNYCVCKQGFGFDDYGKCILMHNPHESYHQALKTIKNVITEQIGQIDGNQSVPSPLKSSNNDEVREQIQVNVDQGIDDLSVLHDRNENKKLEQNVDVTLLLVTVLAVVVTLIFISVVAYCCLKGLECSWCCSKSVANQRNLNTDNADGTEEENERL